MLLSGPVASSQPALGATAAETGATPIMAAVISDDGVLTDIGTREPVTLPSIEEPIPVPGGTVVWRPTRDWIDDLGYRHVFYKQH